MAERFVLGVHVMTYGATWPEVAAVGREIDRLGYDFLLMHDHLLATQGNLYQPFFESYTTLGAWAGMTNQVRLGHLTVGNPFRNPGVVAKATTTLDHISNGRMTLCLGAGSLPEEFPLHGLAVGQTLAGRLHALDESLSIVTRLLDGEEVNFESKNYYMEKVKQRPRPLQRHVPVIVGASGEKIGLRIAAKYADYWQMSVDPTTVDQFRHKSEVLDAHCRDVGRDPALVSRVPEGSFLIRETREEARDAFGGLRRPLRLVGRIAGRHGGRQLGRDVRGDRRESPAIPRGRHLGSDPPAAAAVRLRDDPEARNRSPARARSGRMT